MPLLTAAQRNTLGSWSFLADHQNHRGELVEVARIVYQTLKGAGGKLTEAECEAPLKNALLGVGVFTKMLRSKHHAQPTLYEPFAEAMARLLLDEDWKAIMTP